MMRRASEVRQGSADVQLQAVRIVGTERRRDGGNEFVVYILESGLLTHGVQTTLRTERRCDARAAPRQEGPGQS